MKKGRKLFRKSIAIVVVICILTGLTFSASAKTTTELASVTADQRVENLVYAYNNMLVGADGTDYGEFESKKAEFTIINGTSNFGLKALAGWKVASGATGVTAQSDTDKVSGTYSMKFTNSLNEESDLLKLYPAVGNHSLDNWTGDITGLVPYGNYQFSFWYKGNKTFKVNYYTHTTGNIDNLVETTYTAIEEWKQVSINLMADNTGKIQLWIDLSETTPSGQFVLIDNVDFYRCGVTADGKVNLFGDDGFESSVLGNLDFLTDSAKWQYIKDSAGNYTHFARSYDATSDQFTMCIAKEGMNGSNCLKIAPKSTATFTTSSPYSLNLRPQYTYYNYTGNANTTGCVPCENGYYTLSFWVKGDPTLYGIYIPYGDDALALTTHTFSNFKQANQKISTAEWRQVVLPNIQITKGYIYADIRIYIYGNNDASPLYLDDIQLVKQDNYILNGNFECADSTASSIDGVYGFIGESFAGNTVEITNDAFSGNNALKVTFNDDGSGNSTGGMLYPSGMTGAGGDAQASYENLPSGDYIISLWTKGDRGKYYFYKDTVKNNRVQLQVNSNWTLDVLNVAVSESAPIATQMNFIQSDSNIGKYIIIDDYRIETVANALFRVEMLINTLSKQTNRIEEIRQWLGKFGTLIGKVNGIDETTVSDLYGKFYNAMCDISNDGKLDSSDISLTKSHLLSTESATYNIVYDTNYDKTVDIRDLVFIKANTK